MSRGARWQHDSLGDAPEYIKAQLGMGTKKNKYNAQRSQASDFYHELAGRSFASKLERNRAQELVLLQRSKDIRKLSYQPKVLLTRAECSYRPDFYYEERIAPRRFVKVWEEVKGKECYPWLTNKKLWRVYGPGMLRIVKAGKYGPKIVDEIIPKG